MRRSVKFLILTTSVVFLITYTALSQECKNVIESALKKWNALQDYSCQMYTYNKKDEKVDERIYQYKFLKPNYVYMKVLKGKSKGAKVFYDPQKNKVRGCKKIFFTICKTFDPSHKKVTSIRGVKVYETSFGYILKIAKTYLDMGKQCKVYKENGFTVVELESDVPIFQEIVREKLYFDTSGFPVKWERYSPKEVVYKLVCENVKINNGFSVKDLKP